MELSSSSSTTDVAAGEGQLIETETRLQPDMVSRGVQEMPIGQGESSKEEIVVAEFPRRCVPRPSRRSRPRQLTWLVGLGHLKRRSGSRSHGKTATVPEASMTDSCARICGLL